MGLDCTSFSPLLCSLLWFLLYIFSCRSFFSATLQVFLINRCSVNSCNFGEPVGGGELMIFLLCHPGPHLTPQNLYSNQDFDRILSSLVSESAQILHLMVLEQLRYFLFPGVRSSWQTPHVTLEKDCRSTDCIYLWWHCRIFPQYNLDSISSVGLGVKWGEVLEISTMIADGSLLLSNIWLKKKKKKGIKAAWYHRELSFSSWSVNQYHRSLLFNPLTASPTPMASDLANSFGNCIHFAVDV